MSFSINMDFKIWNISHRWKVTWLKILESNRGICSLLTGWKIECWRDKRKTTFNRMCWDLIKKLSKLKIKSIERLKSLLIKVHINVSKFFSVRQWIVPKMSKYPSSLIQKDWCWKIKMRVICKGLFWCSKQRFGDQNFQAVQYFHKNIL